MRFVRRVTGKSERAATSLLDQVAAGVDAAVKASASYAEQHPDARDFANLLGWLLRRGLDRLTSQPA